MSESDIGDILPNSIIIINLINNPERLKDGFLPRFKGRGFSDQVGVPIDIHEKAMADSS